MSLSTNWLLTSGHSAHTQWSVKLTSLDNQISCYKIAVIIYMDQRAVQRVNIVFFTFNMSSYFFQFYETFVITILFFLIAKWRHEQETWKQLKKHYFALNVALRNVSEMTYNVLNGSLSNQPVFHLLFTMLPNVHTAVTEPISNRNCRKTFFYFCCSSRSSLF